MTREKHKNVCDAAKARLREIYFSYRMYIRKEDKSKINHLRFQLKKQKGNKAKRMKEIVKIGKIK